MAIRIYGTSFDSADAALAAPFWADVLGRRVNPGATKESASLVARDGSGDTPIMFHAVPETKVVKNRLHLDLVADDFDAELTRLRGLGPPNSPSSRTGPRSPTRRERVRPHPWLMGVELRGAGNSRDATMAAAKSKVLSNAATSSRPLTLPSR